MMTTSADRFAMARPQHELPVSSAAPSGTRPYGLRVLTSLGTTDGAVSPTYVFDHARQIALDSGGAPLWRNERMQRTSTGSSDGGSGPMEEWTYDK